MRSKTEEKEAVVPTYLQDIRKLKTKTHNRLEDLECYLRMKCDGTRILVIDDNGVDLRVMTEILRKAHYRVVSLSDPTQIKIILAADDIGMIVSDIKMPNYDGVAISKLLKDNHIPCAMMTGLDPNAKEFLAVVEIGVPVVQKIFMADIIKVVEKEFGPPIYTRKEDV